MKKILSLFLSALIAFAPFQEAQSQYSTPVVNTTYDQAVHNIPVVAHYTFGSAATTPTNCAAGGACVAITNSTLLGTYWDPLNINAQTTKVNAELETYNPSFTASLNHVFNSTDLQLTGTLDGGGNVTPFVYGNLGNNPGFTATSFVASNIGLSDVSMLHVGQSLYFTYLYHGVITGISGSGGTATITTTALFGSNPSIGAGFFTPWEVMPFYFANANQATAAGGNVIHFAAVPADVANGQFVSFYNNTSNTNQHNDTINSFQTYTVTAHDATSVTLDKNLVGPDAVANGQRIAFTPPIRSGQIWSKTQYYQPGWHGITYFAMKARIQIPHSVPYAQSGSISGADANSCYGKWPAWWYFSGLGTGFTNASEVDDLEMYGTILRTDSQVDPNLHQGSSATLPLPVTDFLYNPSSWTLAANLYTYNSSADYSSGFHDFAVETTPDAVYYYIDNIMVKKTNYHWTSAYPVTVSLNLAIGSLAAGLGTNNLWPIASTNFPMPLKVQEIEFRTK